VLVAGALAEGLSPGGVVAIAGGAGLIAVVPPLLAYRRSSWTSVAGPRAAAGRSGA
jgi:hypothetical protein